MALLGVALLASNNRWEKCTKVRHLNLKEFTPKLREGTCPNSYFLSWRYDNNMLSIPYNTCMIYLLPPEKSNQLSTVLMYGGTWEKILPPSVRSTNLAVQFKDKESTTGFHPTVCQREHISQTSLKTYLRCGLICLDSTGNSPTLLQIMLPTLKYDKYLPHSESSVLGSEFVNQLLEGCQLLPLYQLKLLDKEYEVLEGSIEVGLFP